MLNGGFGAGRKGRMMRGVVGAGRRGEGWDGEVILGQDLMEVEAGSSRYCRVQP
jgi:hypothetical protein